MVKDCGVGGKPVDGVEVGAVEPGGSLVLEERQRAALDGGEIAAHAEMEGGVV